MSGLLGVSGATRPPFRHAATGAGVAGARLAGDYGARGRAVGVCGISVARKRAKPCQ